MKISVEGTVEKAGQVAARAGSALIAEAIERRGFANIILATGASQFEMLKALAQEPSIDWSRVTVFHLDEYIGLSEDHTASFVGYLKARFVERVPALKTFHAIDGLADPSSELARLNALIADAPIDVAFIGIGENGHLAFNDPPADFDAKQAYIEVALDEACRRQQVGEGWFASMDDVPRRAISMSIPQILKSGAIICTVPDSRKAEAVRGAVEGPVSNLCPASALQRHPQVFLFLDEPAASLIRTKG
ncbi:glucosamine-6-phosphate deaminase [Martelella radicis]|uniref:Glucosamine-6-phosphate deaminase n=1 Tax=Martelella radicis TaxID=1397476 RepID=A0A7W6KNU4_9HYPH|nr:glucosamine-6-phosphate deaminase [Martelella radicis]MBB4124608.1 glucosamine-6-phosphate deaminase [Martelella radicis]